MAAGERGIYVSIMLFDGWDLTNSYNDTSGFPMASGNNINGVATTPAEFLSLSNPAITALQEAYVRKVIDTVNDLDNVLYEIANETGNARAAIAWQYHWIDLIHTVEKGMPKQHPAGMTSTFPGSDTDLYASNADSISPNTQLAAGDGRKVVLNDTDHSYGWTQLQSDGPAAQRAWAWETFCLGAAPLFMDPYLETWAGRNSPSGSTPDPQWNAIRDALGYIARWASVLNLEHAVPSPSLCSTGYCLAQPGHQYLVYQPASGSFQLTVTAGSYRRVWFDPVTGAQSVDGSLITLDEGQYSFTRHSPAALYCCSCRPDREARGRPIAHLELRANPRYWASRPQPATYPWSGAARPESTFPCAASPSRLPCLATPISYLMITELCSVTSAIGRPVLAASDVDDLDDRLDFLIGSEALLASTQYLLAQHLTLFETAEPPPRRASPPQPAIAWVPRRLDF